MATSSPKTWGAGHSAPDDTRNQRNTLLGIAATLFCIAPLGTLIAYATYQIGLVRLRLHWQLLAAPGVLLAALWLKFGGGLRLYFTGHRELLSGIAHHKDLGTLIADNIGRWILCELPAAGCLGIAAGSLYSSWRWYRRPSWEENDRRPWWWITKRLHAEESDIASDLNGPTTGVTLGVNPETGERKVQSDIEGGSHTLITGGSGTGKTSALLIQTRDVIRYGRGLVIIDLKGSDDIPQEIAAWCERYGRVFHHWTFIENHDNYTGPASGLSYYEPVGRGDPTRMAGMLLATREWSAEADHYKKIVEGFLQVAFNIRQRLPDTGRDAISDMVSMCTDPIHLAQRGQALWRTLSDAPKAENAGVLTGADHGRLPELLKIESNDEEPWVARWSELDNPVDRALFQSLNSYLTFSANSSRFSVQDTIVQFGQSLNTFKQSIAGRLLDRDPSGERNINLARAAREGQVVVFSLNSSNYPEPAAALATMIIQDIKTVSGELRGDPVWRGSTNPHDRLHVYIDEFGVLKADNTKTLLQQVRDARISVSLSTQSVSDLAYHSPEFRDAILNTVASFLALRPNTSEEAELLAGLTGRRIKQVKQIGIEQSSSIGGIDTGAATGTGFLRDEETTVIEPMTFQSLGRGEAIYITAGEGSRQSTKIRVIREDKTKADTFPGPGFLLQDPDPAPPAATGPALPVAPRAPLGAAAQVPLHERFESGRLKDPEPDPAPPAAVVAPPVVPEPGPAPTTVERSEAPQPTTVPPAAVARVPLGKLPPRPSQASPQHATWSPPVPPVASPKEPEPESLEPTATTPAPTAQKSDNPLFEGVGGVTATEDNPRFGDR